MYSSSIFSYPVLLFNVTPMATSSSLRFVAFFLSSNIQLFSSLLLLTVAGNYCMLEQLRIATNRRDDEVTIGVTLKNITGYDKIDEDYMKDERSGL